MMYINIYVDHGSSLYEDTKRLYKNIKGLYDFFVCEESGTIHIERATNGEYTYHIKRPKISLQIVPIIWIEDKKQSLLVRIPYKHWYNQQDLLYEAIKKTEKQIEHGSIQARRKIKASKKKELIK